MADFSKAIEGTAAWTNFYKTVSGKCFYAFDMTGGGADKLFGKDPTVGGDMTRQTFWLEKVVMTCSSSAPKLLDGSALSANLIGPLGAGLISSTNNITLDFGKDAIACLTAESTSSFCISAADKGFWTCHIWGYWGCNP